MGYSKASEQLQSSARPICNFRAMTRMGSEPATIHIAACWSSLHYTLRHGGCGTYSSIRRQKNKQNPP